MLSLLMHTGLAMTAAAWTLFTNTCIVKAHPHCRDRLSQCQVSTVKFAQRKFPFTFRKIAEELTSRISSHTGTNI